MTLLSKLAEDHQMPDPAALSRGIDTDYDQRATHYFTNEQLLSLEVVMLKIRTEMGIKVGKSELMRAALDFIVEDFSLNKTRSWIAQRIKAEAAREKGAAK